MTDWQMLPYDLPFEYRARVFYSVFSSIGSKGHTEFQALVTKINRISGTANNFFKLRVPLRLDIAPFHSNTMGHLLMILWIISIHCSRTLPKPLLKQKLILP